MPFWVSSSGPVGYQEIKNFSILIKVSVKAGEWDSYKYILDKNTQKISIKMIDFNNSQIEKCML